MVFQTVEDSVYDPKSHSWWAELLIFDFKAHEGFANRLIVPREVCGGVKIITSLLASEVAPVLSWQISLKNAL